MALATELAVTSRIFIRKTKKGSIRKVVREHYLRDDIGCGSADCETCEPLLVKDQPTLDGAPDREVEGGELHYLLPDVNTALKQMDILEDIAFHNVIILQTVLQEVRHSSLSVYKRLTTVVSDPSKHFYVFNNEHHSACYMERAAGESSVQRNDRAIRAAAHWYSGHLGLSDLGTKVYLLCGDEESQSKARNEGLTALSVSEYVKKITGREDLIDKVAHIHLAMQEGGSEEGRFGFPVHLPLSEIQRGVKSNRFLQGSFHPSRENYLEAAVTVHGLEHSIFLQGRKSLNRAVQDDVVAVEMLPKEEWTCPSSMVLDDQGATEGGEEEDDAEEKLKEKRAESSIPTGRVVGIVRRKWRQYCGVLQASLLKDGTRHLFVPAEKRIPKVRIETRQAEHLANQRIVVAIDSWPKNSRYPLGHFVRVLGPIGDKDTENEVLLLEHDVPHSPFSPRVLGCLPSIPWSISQEDREKRVDLRSLAICSVDPPGCTDIDDALHCRPHPTKPDLLEVGVHIADVTHFVRPGTALDEEAARRGTSVYLSDKRIDMVPELLSSNLCSLRSEVERFAFTVIWEMTPEAEIVSARFHKSIIKSKASLTYGEAQLIIDETEREDDIAQGLRKLNVLAKLLKQKRMVKGALSLASNEVRFHVDSETHDPIDVETKVLRDTNSMVEEFMLLANISVAEQIFKDFPQCAVLRRHPEPPPSNFEPLLTVGKAYGIELDVSSAKKLAESLDKASKKRHGYFDTLLRTLTTRCMMQAVYFSSGMVPESEFTHYGLASPIYTHFTSPIRRYADVMVHRLLAVSIGADSSYADLLVKQKTEALCQQLNFRHKMAQYASRASVGLHTQLFFRGRQTEEEGYVLFVRRNALQILIPKYGLEGTLSLTRVNGELLTGITFVHNEQTCTQSYDGTTFHIFDKVTVKLSINDKDAQHQRLQLQLVKPYIKGFSLEKSPTEDPVPAKKKRTK